MNCILKLEILDELSKLSRSRIVESDDDDTHASNLFFRRQQTKSKVNDCQMYVGWPVMRRRRCQ